MKTRHFPSAAWRMTLLGACCAALVSCGSKPSAATGTTSERKPRIVCTIGMVADIVRQVAGDKADVIGIMGSGIDPHLYKPARNDVATLQSADLVFYNGLMLEGKMTDALVRVARADRPVLAVTEKLDEKFLLEPPEFAGHFDPHVWMDVAAWRAAVEAVANGLAAFDPPHAEYYNANAAAYQDELTKLDEYARRVIGSIPQDRRVLITAHDAFNYFGRAYGIEVRGIQGLSTESEAGMKDITELVDLIVARGVQAVFVETSVADKNVRALVEGAKSRGREIRIGGTLFSDAMGAEGTYEGTYIGMLDHNATIIARALGGDAPERGMQGKLATK